MPSSSSQSPQNSPPDDRLLSWKEIATYLNCSIRTVQRWERFEGLPVHRHVHQNGSTVYAFKPELDAWRNERRSAPPELDSPRPPSRQAGADAAPAGDDLGGAAELEEPAAGADQAPAAAPPAHRSGEDGYSRIRAYGIWLAAAIILIAAVYFVRQLVHPPVKPQANRIMLAVLPFANLSGDPGQDYFCDGLTEEMITKLGSLNPRRLGIIARTSSMTYQHSRKDVAQIGRELGVSYILEGSARRWGGNIRISAQLIQVSDQTHVWAHSYNFPARDVLSVQQEVAQSIARKIQLKLESTRSGTRAARGTVDPQAHEDYLKGRYFWNLRSTAGFREAIDQFQRAIGIDPNYAQAYAGLADCYTLLALYGAPPRQVMPQAKAAALRSLALDSSLAEAHTSLAGVEAVYEWNWDGAEREFKRALDLNPNYAPAHHWYANFYLIPQGRYDEAIAEMKLAQELDPVSLIVNNDLGWTYYVARRDGEALAQYRKTLELSPEFVPVHFRLSQYYERRRLYDQAAEEAEAALRFDGQAEAAATMARAYAARGYAGVRQEQINSMENRAKSAGYSSASLAALDGAAGDKEQAFAVLQNAIEDRAPDLIYLRSDPIYDTLRNDPRFADIERRIGLVP